MYGTVARMVAKPGGEAALMDLLRQFDQRKPQGALGVYTYRMDSDPNEFYLVAVFRDRESYVTNAESPEQDAEYRKMRDLLMADPEWHDGEMAYSSQ
jgi:quinol monooxygenase YgiN